MQRFVSVAPAGIRFSNYVFSEPVSLARWWPPRGAGVYAILVADFTWAPRPFQPIFFGQYGDASAKPVSEEEYVSWFRVAAGRDLYIASQATPTSDSGAVRRELIRAYTPICNRDFELELARRLELLEKRDQEQEALLKIVLAAMGRMLEPPPEPRKRTFGFHPEKQSPDAAPPSATGAGRSRLLAPGNSARRG